LIEGKEGDYYIGRSYRDAPEVDGEVLIPANGKKLNPGEFYTVDVFDYNEYDLYANISRNGRKK
jgi:ribosomal protein S12 methylthiotransferase